MWVVEKTSKSGRQYLKCAGECVQQDRKEEQHTSAVKLDVLSFTFLDLPAEAMSDNYIKVIPTTSAIILFYNNSRDSGAGIASQPLKATFNAKHYLLIHRERIW